MMILDLTMIWDTGGAHRDLTCTRLGCLIRICIEVLVLRSRVTPHCHDSSNSAGEHLLTAGSITTIISSMTRICSMIRTWVPVIITRYRDTLTADTMLVLYIPTSPNGGLHTTTSHMSDIIRTYFFYLYSLVSSCFQMLFCYSDYAFVFSCTSFLLCLACHLNHLQCTSAWSYPSITIYCCNGVSVSLSVSGCKHSLCSAHVILFSDFAFQPRVAQTQNYENSLR